MEFVVVGPITGLETIAYGNAIREVTRLRKQYGIGRWRKRKGYAMIRLQDGAHVHAELHWYEATGVGRREIKIKRILKEEP